jgi:dipeptidyl aminopeptidase/acylaminoacyl peptidase
VPSCRVSPRTLDSADPALWTPPKPPRGLVFFALGCLMGALLAALPVAAASALGVHLPIAGANAGTDAAPRTVLAGHPGGVRDIAFSPDPALVASVGADRTLRLWSTADGQEIARLQAHDPESGEQLRLMRVAFSPDGETLAAGASDGSVWLWPTAGGDPAHYGSGVEVSSLAFSPDGRRLAVGSNDGTVRLWDPVGRRALRTLYGHNGMIAALAFSPDGGALASSGWDGKVLLWDVGRGRQTDELDAGGVMLDVAFSPEGTSLVGGGPAGVRYWDLAAGGGWNALAAAPSIRAVVFAADGRRLAAAAVDGSDWRLGLADRRESPALRATGRPSLVALSSDARLLAAAPLDGESIGVWPLPAA